jgi:hypothetical protein
VVTIVFGVCASSSYAQLNCNTSCEVNALVMLSQPGGSGDSAVGFNALVGGNTSSFATAVGSLALSSNTTGEFNTATGNSALQFNTTGPHNTADGTDALVFNTTGGDNTAVGETALEVSTGSGNTAVGFQACSNVTTASSVTCLGVSVLGANVSNSTYIGGIYNRPTQGKNNPEVCIDKNGKLGTIGCVATVGQELINQQREQIQLQAQQIADLQQRLSQLESLITKK